MMDAAALASAPVWQQVGEQFITYYYQQFDADRTQLAALYQDSSMLTFEGQQFMGPAQIVEKLSSLAFQTVVHLVTTVDCQPTTNNGVAIFVIGQLKTDNEEHPMSFSQTPAGSYYCLNDIFRLNVHHN